jgi:hypothetical protein
MLSRGKSSFKARYGRGLCSHPRRNLSLGKSSGVPRFEQQIEQNAFVTLNAFDLLSYARAPHQLGDNLIMSSHA